MTKSTGFWTVADRVFTATRHCHNRNAQWKWIRAGVTLIISMLLLA